MIMKKLELTWVGKDEPINVEPRILIEDKNLSNIDNDSNTENMLIHGDNLLALKALEKEYSGQIKFIYIDPPYNTGNAFDLYDDNLEHSIWLNLMKQRLEILHSLLDETGYLVIQIDDDEMAYLKVLMDEIFGRTNFINCITVETGEVFGKKAAHIDKKFVKVKDYLLIYSKSEKRREIIPLYTSLDEQFDTHYSYYIDDDYKVIKLIDFIKGKEEFVQLFENYKIDLKLSNFSKMMKLNSRFREFIYSISKKIYQDQPYSTNVSSENEKLLEEKQVVNINGKLIYKTKTGTKRYYKSFDDALKYTDDYFPVYTRATARGDLWKYYHIDMRNIKKEGDVDLKSSKKPERLIRDILKSFNKDGGLVLDSFLGSGTTASVAHKLGLNWIGIEMGNHAYTHAKKRIDYVIEGDKTGISNLVNWTGGGGYRFYELAPTLIKKDLLEIEVINDSYNAEMLASAVALHEGYKYSPDETIFWKQAVGTESSYLYTTTNHIDSKYIESIVSTMNDEEHLLIACTSFDEGLDRKHKNISIKKIPQMILSKCEYKEEGYPLNIINPPVIEEDEEDEDE